METKVKGRVVYVEPNDFRNQIGGTFGSGDNVYWQPEDLSISVDLQVIVPNRDSCGTDIWKNVNLTTSDKGWTSFFRGTDIKEDEPYLTDSFTDISFQEITESGAGSKEALGIKSIDIQFDSHFYPVVKMRLIDVRGASLMMPSEYNANGREKTCQEFFSAIFHFPYPRFALSVKGFYGSRVTFMLAVNDFSSSFNSQTGNFEAEVSFIGHMYGLYTDLPMSCLLIAPYLSSRDGGKNDYWNKQVENRVFTFNDGSPIPTFKEFIAEKYEKMSENFESEYSDNKEAYAAIDEIDKERAKVRLLENISNRYNELINGIAADKTTLELECKDNKNYNFIFLKAKKDSVFLPSAVDFWNMYDSYNELAGESGKLTLPDGFGDDGLPWGKTVSAKDPIVKKTKNEDGKEEYNLVTSHTYYDLLTDNSQKILIESAKTSTDAYCENVYAVPYDNNFLCNVDSKKNEAESNVARKISESSKELNELTRKILGFVPSIENVIRMLFAHIDAFMHAYYRLLGTIKSDMPKTRKSSAFGFGKNNSRITTDIDSSGTTYSIPPFTGFYETDIKTNNTVRKYPGDIPELRKFAEVKFIEDIYKAIDASWTLPNDEGGQNNGGPVDDWNWLSLLDVLEPENPYKSFSASDDFFNKLLLFVWERLVKASLSGHLTNDMKIKGEVDNFWKVHGETLSNASTDIYRKVLEEISIFIGEGPAKNIQQLNDIRSKGGKQKTLSMGTGISYEKEKQFGYFDEDNSKPGFYEITGYTIDEILSKAPEYCAEKIIKDADYSSYDGTFLSSPYPKGGFEHATVGTDKEDKGDMRIFIGKISEDERKKRIREASIEPENFIYPVLQSKDESGKSVDYCYYVNANSAETNDMEFLSCFLGKSKNVFLFDKDNTSIVNMPAYVPLFLGSMISTTGNEANFPLNTKGFHTFNEKEWISELDGVSVSNLKDMDAIRGGLSEFYSKQARMADFFKKAERDTTTQLLIKLGKEEIKGNYVYGGKTSEYMSKIIELATSKSIFIRVLYTNAVNPIGKLREFMSDVKEKMEAAGKNTENVGNGASEGNTDAVANAGETAYARRDQKTQLYYTLKNLYDKWLSCYDQNRFKLGLPEIDTSTAYKKNTGQIESTPKITEVQSFMYVDTFYNNIGSTFMITPESIVKLISSDRLNRSVMQFIADLAYENKLLFVPLPVFTNMYDAKTIGSIFTPQSLYGRNELSAVHSNERGIGNTYVFMYTHEPAYRTVSTKNKNSTEYQTDSLFFDDTEVPVQLAALKPGDSGYTVPAFGVTFGKQNQMYFKNINVNMSNPKETDISIANRFILADNERRGDSRAAPRSVGQNLFSIYSNRSYECSVDMMGCANIMPMMYFQLNNIPMFRGAYRIFGVRHHIENGSMTTSFTGQKISKNSVPFLTNVIDIETLLENMNRKAAEEGGNNYETLKDGVIVSGRRGVTWEGVDPDIKTYDTPIGSDKKPIVFNVVKAINRLHENIDSGAIKDGKKVEPYCAYEKENFNGTYGRCATFVKEAVNAGFKGTDFENRWTAGYNGYFCRQVLNTGKKDDETIVPTLHFNLIYSDYAAPGKRAKDYTGVFEPGDIVCTYRHDTKNHPLGHVAIYDGSTFVSDCVQTGAYGYGGASVNDQSRYELYRYSGDILYPSTSLKLTINILPSKYGSINVYESNTGWEKVRQLQFIENIYTVVIPHPASKSASNVQGTYYYAELSAVSFSSKLNPEIQTFNAEGKAVPCRDLNECFEASKDRNTLFIDLTEIADKLAASVVITIAEK